jgi:hypothetical protein
MRGMGALKERKLCIKEKLLANLMLYGFAYSEIFRKEFMD